MYYYLQSSVSFYACKSVKLVSPGSTEHANLTSDQERSHVIAESVVYLCQLTFNDLTVTADTITVMRNYFFSRFVLCKTSCLLGYNTLILRDERLSIQTVVLFATINSKENVKLLNVLVSLITHSYLVSTFYLN